MERSDIYETGPVASTPERSAPVTEPEAERDPTAPAEREDEGVLVGTGTERAPGVGGLGDHPAPAAMRDPVRGGIHVAGEPPAGTIAGSSAPADSEDVQAGGDVTDEDARERLNAVTEPEPYETERPDIGTE